ncbi:DEAD/DEAH box helicase [Roseofilum capinflatum]|uniref:DEAD/DEAH box helicase n=1 Tax=Roseofilum capinflatum BLCC-M114 TaxID=3022440 RepID=A0ABT7B6A4_9CYAN|nr:DEAD/DEAH box helicase [Roseofilum capinflatum]MDJ1174707.1 DEAD/DEAH box helicase [Roseofilum capinflatum BLCC-M114]
MKLRPFQIEALRNVYSAIKDKHNRILLVAPTGAGKTVIAAQLIQHAYERKISIMFIVHLDILVPQTASKLLAFGLNENEIGYIKNGYPERKDALIQIASVQTLARRRWWREQLPRVVVFDEAHETTFSSVGDSIVNELATETTRIIGLTATPYRLSKRQGMGQYYDKLIQAELPYRLQEQGFLAKMRYFGLPQPEAIASIPIRAGDFQSEGSERAMVSPEVISNTVTEWQRLTESVEKRSTIAFCVSVKHARALADAFNEAGYRADMVCGETHKDERKRLYSALDEGDLDVLTSVNVISIGFDLPSIRFGLLARPTKSKAVHFQQIGRVMRPSPGKEYGTIIDTCGNLDRHGYPEAIRRYYLDHPKDGEPGDAPIKACEACGNIDHISAKVCSACGHPYPIAEKETKSETLREKDPFSKDKDRFQKMLRTAYRKFDKSPSACGIEFYKKYGFFPRQEWKLNAVFDTVTEDNLFAYQSYLLCTMLNPKPSDLTFELVTAFGAGYYEKIKEAVDYPAVG